MILHPLDLLMRHNTNVHSLPMMLPPKLYNFFSFLRVEKRYEEKRSTQGIMSTGKVGNSPDFKEMLNCILQISL